MFAIESARGDRRWISALVTERSEATAQIQAMSTGLGIEHQVVHIQLEDFPVFIVEERNRFEFCTGQEVLGRLAALRPSGENDHVHFKFYVIPAPYVPVVPGRDEMGRMRHWHVGDRELSSPGREALLVELS